MRQRATSMSAIRNLLIAAPSPAVWTPASEPAGTFSLWLDAQDRGSYTSSGGFIAMLGDKSGSGNHAVQAADSLKPIEMDDGFKIQDGRYFNSALSASNNSETAFVVCSNFDLGGNRTILGASANGGRQFRTTSSNMQLVRASVAAVATSSSLPVQTNINCILECQVELGAPVVFGLNGALQSTASHTTGFSAGTVTQIGASLGGQGAQITGREVLILPSKPSAQLADRIRTYLKSKWAIS
ncbi:hypothetical protein NF681_11535 [Comamonadaceae bacterium OTU4NAUVB1]|nr:hypothetical protein NF681_11535 [Comamonadaceae bacterium OTU4NAUVB1]